MTDLKIGQEYVVRALENRDESMWFYLHTVTDDTYPFPYPAEFFEVIEASLPSGWSISFQTIEGNVTWKRISFSAWANDEHFYERLVSGESNATFLYRSQTK